MKAKKQLRKNSKRKDTHKLEESHQIRQYNNKTRFLKKIKKKNNPKEDGASKNIILLNNLRLQRYNQLTVQTQDKFHPPLM